MAGLQGGNRPAGNGRYGGGTGGAEHRYSRAAVDCDRRDEATCGATDNDTRWNGARSEVHPWPNTMGVSRGALMGAEGPGSWPDGGFMS
jgi:hypothetical protein